MRESVSALALIRRDGPAGIEWLVQWNETWAAFNLVGGHRENGETFRECLVRELAEELGVSPGEYRVADASAAHLEYEAWSWSRRETTKYTMELFDVELLGDVAVRVLRDESNRWVTTAEILARCCQDGKRVSETVETVLGKAGLLS